jgi:hypothetical protein
MLTKFWSENLRGRYCSEDVGVDRCGACSTIWRDRNCIQNFWSENLKGRCRSKDRGVDGRLVLEWILGK